MINKIRLFTGLVLFSYVTLHLLSHAAGLWSLTALTAANRVLHWPWERWPGQTLLYGALATHLALAFYALYRRRRLRMRFGEAAQLLLGLAIFPLLFPHIVGTRTLSSVYGGDADYISVLMALWYPSPSAGLRQLLVLLIAWGHGCIGLYYWLRLQPWYRSASTALYSAALLLPTLSLLGYLQAAKDVLELAADPDWLARTTAAYALEDGVIAQLGALRTAGIAAFFALLALTLLLRWLRLRRQRRAGLVELYYDNDAQARFPAGRSILEASREAGIAHASVCGGRGRCSTCRVRVLGGAEHLPEPSAAEQEVLDRIGAGARIRLACQTRPSSGTVRVARLLSPGYETARDGRSGSALLQGEERHVAVLFADLRAFTQLSEHKLPYDVVFLLNQYFHSMGTAIEQSGGRVDKFIGDGIMALFGIDGGVDGDHNAAAVGSRRALAAAAQMSRNLASLNRSLSADLETPLRIGIGIHAGPAIVGEMGFATVKSVTAIGDTVNTASRLEPLTKDYGVELVVSETVAAHADADLSAFERREITVRGRRAPLAVRLVPVAGALS